LIIKASRVATRAVKRNFLRNRRRKEADERQGKREYSIKDFLRNF